MEFTINKDYFFQAVSHVSKAIESTKTDSILAGIKITAGADRITIVGCNSTFSIKKQIPTKFNGTEQLQIYRAGTVVIPAKHLLELLKKLPDEITMKMQKDFLVTLNATGISINIKGLNPEQYPALLEINENSKISITITSSKLIEILKSTMYAASNTITKPVLTGIMFSFQQDQLTCTATNSHRLAYRRMAINSNVNTCCIVPKSALNELLKLLSHDELQVNITITDHEILFSTSTFHFHTRIIDGKYPDVTSLLLGDAKTIVTIHRKQLLQGIERANFFAKNSRNNNIHFELLPDFTLKISSKSTEIGDIKEIQSITSLQGENDVNITLDGQLLIDVLKVMKEDEISIRFNGSLKPVLIQPVDETYHKHLISPVRTK
ncbi:DNA polymerase III subunit beta [Sutcliffiella cohnii]|uniref:Beta sliding clamp n=1 Tax=Sutcliffiella cohnii TaxID=33932 RepID=A0A223KT21_9BACI|nr:DNA polymerase III subunit beta [Sutcliffiella cohnii]AST92517.1 DNA polymerase III subunit beta [Sutcliffiella cohnii]